MHIPDTAIEAAAKAVYEAFSSRAWENCEPLNRTDYYEDARLGLKAAAPHIAAEALRDAAEAMRIANPAAGVPAMWLRLRAHQYESSEQ